jgi:hypothetical protein
MKSAYQIAKEIGVTPQAVYKKLTPELLNQLANNVVQLDSGYRFNEEGEWRIKGIFGIEPTIEPVVEPVVEPVQQQLISWLQSELEKANQRNHELSMQIADLTRNSQLLLGMEKESKRKWWQRLLPQKQN